MDPDDPLHVVRHHRAGPGPSDPRLVRGLPLGELPGEIVHGLRGFWVHQEARLVEVLEVRIRLEESRQAAIGLQAVRHVVLAQHQVRLAGCPADEEALQLLNL